MRSRRQTIKAKSVTGDRHLGRSVFPSKNQLFPMLHISRDRSSDPKPLVVRQASGDGFAFKGDSWMDSRGC